MMSTQNLLSEIEKKSKEKKEYEYFLIHQVRYEYILNKIIEISNGNKLRILDIGCFPYHIGYALELLGHDVYGIASSHEPVKNKNIAVINIEQEKFPYKDNFFDLILCNEVVEHLPHSPIFPLQEIYRITKKGGNLMITTPNIARSINRVKLLFGKSIMYPIDVYFEEDGKGNNIYHRHNREYTLAELVTLFHKTSWKIEKENYFISYTPFRKRIISDSLILKIGKYLNYFTMFIFPSLQDTLFVLGKK